MTGLVFVSMDNWDHVWRRNQFLCTGYARRHPEGKILFVGLSRDVSHAARSGGHLDLKPQTISLVPDAANIFVSRPLKMARNSLAARRRLNAAITMAGEKVCSE